MISIHHFISPELFQHETVADTVHSDPPLPMACSGVVADGDCIVSYNNLKLKHDKR